MNSSPFLKKLQEEPQSLLPIGYVLLVLMGMVNEAIYYKQFQINIFEYSEIFDFLIAPFKKIEYILFLSFAFGMAIITFAFDRFLQNRFPKLHNTVNFGAANKSWFSAYRYFGVLTTFLVLLIFYSSKNSQKQRNNLLDQQASDILIEFNASDQESLQAKKIGGNKNYIFVLDKEAQVHIIPTSGAIKQIILE